MLLFSAHDVSRHKALPAVFQHAAATMKAKSSACEVIEDTPSGVSRPPIVSLSMLAP